MTALLLSAAFGAIGVGMVVVGLRRLIQRGLEDAFDIFWDEDAMHGTGQGRKEKL